MRGNELLDKMELINAEYVEAAEAVNTGVTPKKKKRGWIAGIAVAACVTLAILAGSSLIGRIGRTSTIIGGVKREYKNTYVMGSELGILWPWEYKTLSEKFTQLTFSDSEFRSAGTEIAPSRLGEVIGSGEVTGYDEYEEKEHRLAVEVHGIAGISAGRMVAVKLDNEYYLFKNSEYDPPVTFGELLDQYSLDQNLPFSNFTVYEGHKDKGHYRVENDQYIWEVLSSCRDAAFIKDEMWSRGERNYLSFTATSEVLGVYKRVFYVTEDGYIRTNVFDWAYLYDIGEEAAKQIIAYATEHSEETQSEPYTNSLAGTLTEIIDGYILIDDSVLCADPKDGMVFKIPIDDLRISRCIDFEGIGVGDIVVVNFTGDIDVDAGNVVEGAYSLSEGYLHDGGVAVPE